MSNIVSSVGKRVRQLRTQAGMTQERLAERAEISVSFLSMIERGERSPHLETLERLALGLEVPVEALFRPDTVAGPQGVAIDKTDRSRAADGIYRRGDNLEGGPLPSARAVGDDKD
ncbi:helix-turn-helix domain-containing protein [Vulgatibacter sp.]|uniref:helix-turn-helix domain-containing protein n=1 Tax=Vulgatibacter sp. TaxID=1971226 RepID=UPI00356A0736